MTAASFRQAARLFAVAALIILLTWLAGGQAVLGRIDPAFAVPLLVPPLLLLARWLRHSAGAARRRAMLFVLMAAVLIQASLALVLAGAAGWRQLLLVLLAGAAAAALADALVRWHGRSKVVRTLAMLGVTLAWFAAGHMALAWLYRVPVAGVAAAPVTMLSSLPLRWAGGGDLSATIARGANEDPALLRLEAAGPVALVDSLADNVPPPGGALLLAHPRALPPHELVAVDAFVRGGGRAVILADALTSWPVAYPLGDARNPPVTSLLTPLLGHWGVTLAAAPTGPARPRAVDVAGARLRLFSAGRFAHLPSGCRSFADDRIASCRIGRGEAWLVGDADLLFAPLWRPLVPGADHLRRADTMEWLGARLYGGDAGRSVLRPLWIRAPRG